MIFSATLVLFWVCIALVLHTYIAFPLIIQRIAAYKRQRDTQTNVPNASSLSVRSEYPPISIIIAAYNEQTHIEQRVRNIAEQNYPPELLHVFIGSDGSQDSTPALLSSLSKQFSWLHVHIFEVNRGKSAVVNDLALLATTEILIFSDADVLFDQGALAEIVKPFRDERVGAVGGTRITLEKDELSRIHAEESAYLNFDNRIRIAEGACGCLIGAHGCFFALRRSCFRALPLEKAYTDDFFYSMIPLELGFEVRAAERAIVRSSSSLSVRDDFQRKVRYSSTAFASLVRFRALLFDRRVLMSYCFWSHRVIKWFLPLILLLLIFCTAMLQGQSTFYLVFYILELSFATLTLLVHFMMMLRPDRILARSLTFSYYFVSSNVALLLGLVRYVSGKNSTQWKPQR